MYRTTRSVARGSEIGDNLSVTIDELQTVPPLTSRRAYAMSVLSLAVVLAACASVPNRPARPSQSSYSCMEAVVREKLPADISESRAHCLAAGYITRYCSVTEAYLAGAGKELRDLIGAGDAQWNDWRADRAGIKCAREAADDNALASCCAARGY